jgi:hypothetical protein
MERNATQTQRRILGWETVPHLTKGTYLQECLRGHSSNRTGGSSRSCSCVPTVSTAPSKGRRTRPTARSQVRDQGRHTPLPSSVPVLTDDARHVQAPATGYWPTATVSVRAHASPTARAGRLTSRRRPCVRLR